MIFHSGGGGGWSIHPTLRKLSVGPIPLKYTQRLDYGRLAEVLHERGLAGLDSIRELLQLSQDGGMPFCEALVTSNLVSDWDLSMVVCDTFQLPFLPTSFISPNPDALATVDKELFNRHQLVPVDIFGQVMTVAMPGLVPAEILAQVAAQVSRVVLPVVGTVETNRRWIGEFMALAPAPEVDGGWESMFDEADAGLGVAGEATSGLGLLNDPMDAESAPAIPALEPTAAAEVTEMAPDSLLSDIPLDIGDEGMELGEIEAMPADDLMTEPLSILEDPLAALGETASEETVDQGNLEALPPMPQFDPEQRDAG